MSNNTEINLFTLKQQEVESLYIKLLEQCSAVDLTEPDLIISYMTVLIVCGQIDREN